MARAIPDEQVASVGSFVFLYFLCFAAFAIVRTLIGLDPETSLSGRRPRSAMSDPASDP